MAAKPKSKKHRSNAEINEVTADKLLTKQTAEQVYETTKHRRNETFSFGDDSMTKAKEKDPATPGDPPGDPPVATPAEPDTYFCSDCKGVVAKGLAQCPTCGVGMDWTGIA